MATKKKADPRDSYELSLKAFMSMGEAEWVGCCASMDGGGVMHVEEGKAFQTARIARAIAAKEQVNPFAHPPAEPTALAGDRPSYIKDKTERSAEAGGDDAAMAIQLREYKDEKEALENNLKAVNANIDALSLKLAESMEAHGVDSFKVKGVGSVYLQIINRPRVLDADGFIKWLDESGQGAMAPRTVHWKRLESMVKEMIQEAKPLPTTIENFQQTRALIRRA